MTPNRILVDPTPTPVGQVELPDPTQLTAGAPAQIHDYLSQVEAVRQHQLNSLPATDLDAVALAYRGTIERILEQVRTARRRVKAGLYGLCSACNASISPERLELRPWATTCAGCTQPDR